MNQQTLVRGPRPRLPAVLTRQLRRQAARRFAWSKMSGENTLRCEFGIVLRSIRRDMALTLAKRKVPNA